MRAAGVIMCIGCIGCGRIAFDPRSDADTDAGDGLTACERAWLAGPRLSAPKPIAAAATSNTEDAPVLSADGLTLYFSRDLVPARDIFFMQRSALDQPFGAPSLFAPANSAANDAEVRFSRDELEMWISTDRAGGQGGYDLWRATRASTGDPFGTPAPVAELNSGGDEFNPQLLADQRGLYFASVNRPGNVGMTDIWKTQRANAGQPFDPPMLSSLSTAGQDASPTISASGRVMVLARGPGPSLDLWYATRPDASQELTVVGILPEVATGFSYTPYLRPDGCELFFASSSMAAASDLYVSELLEP